jgi:hypothetical protein
MPFNFAVVLVRAFGDKQNTPAEKRKDFARLVILVHSVVDSASGKLSYLVLACLRVF